MPQLPGYQQQPGNQRSSHQASLFPQPASDAAVIREQLPNQWLGSKERGFILDRQPDRDLRFVIGIGGTIDHIYIPAHPGEPPVADLATALFSKDLEAVRTALDRGANPNQTLTQLQTTPLVWAIDNSLNDIAKLLLERNADPSLPTPQPNLEVHVAVAPIYVAASHCNVELFNKLLERGANPFFAIQNDVYQDGHYNGKTARWMGNYILDVP